MGDFLRSAELTTVGVTASDTQAKLLISLAEASVRQFCGWRLTQTTETVSLDGGGRVIFLPSLHVTAITSVVENGVTLTRGTDYRWKSWGELTRLAWSGWYDDEGSVVVSMTHGYASGSDELLKIKQVVLAVVTRLVDNPNERATGYTAGIVGETFAAPPQVPSGLLYQEQADLRAFRLPGLR